MIKHKGYTGVFKVDPDAGVIRGKVVGLKDIITFQGATVAEAVGAFRDSVDEYLAFCASDGVDPERPFSGKFIVRLSPRVHRDLSALAESKGVSVNKLVTVVLAKKARSLSLIPCVVHPPLSGSALSDPKASANTKGRKAAVAAKAMKSKVRAK